MTLKFFLRIRIDSNQIESNANSNRIESFNFRIESGSNRINSNSNCTLIRFESDSNPQQ